MNLKFTFITALLLTAISAVAQHKATETITENELRAHMEFIAGDQMQGRSFGTAVPGLELTAEYLKTQCRLMGLKPVGEDFFQEVKMTSVKPDTAQTFVELLDNDGKALYETHNIFAFGTTDTNDTIEAEIVFGGYGWYDDKTKYNDTEDVNFKGKVLLVMTRNLEMALDTASKKNRMDVEMKKLSKALMGGAKSVIMVPDPQNPDRAFLDEIRNYVMGGRFTLEGKKMRRFMPIKMIFGDEELANKILAETGKTLADLQHEINESGQPHSLELEKVKANIRLTQDVKALTGKNVVAMVEGSDPVLKNECIVYTAHYDHLGMISEEEIFNGADDNASGTVALLEMAEAFQLMKKKPRRSVVFAWVTAEEKGLIGSNYYAEYPLIPLENTLANINLDMVGRSAEQEPAEDAGLEKSLAGPDGVYIVTGNRSKALVEINASMCEKLGLIPNDKLAAKFLGSSDYYHFYKNGIPVLGFSTGLHDDYHKITDTVDKIDYRKMKRVSDLAFLVGLEVANAKERLEVEKKK